MTVLLINSSQTNAYNIDFDSHVYSVYFWTGETVETAKNYWNFTDTDTWIEDLSSFWPALNLSVNDNINTFLKIKDLNAGTTVVHIWSIAFDYAWIPGDIAVLMYEKNTNIEKIHIGLKEWTRFWVDLLSTINVWKLKSSKDGVVNIEKNKNTGDYNIKWWDGWSIMYLNIASTKDKEYDLLSKKLELKYTDVLTIATKDRKIFKNNEEVKIDPSEITFGGNITSWSDAPTTCLECNTDTTALEDLPFTDISDSFAKDFIISLSLSGVINGYLDKTFRPNNPVTRAEFLKMVMRKSGIDISAYSETGATTFKDTSGWIVPFAEKARELGFIQATDAFHPNNQITRAEAIKILLNVSWKTIKEYQSSTFSDISGWKINFIETAKELGIISSADKFRPDDSITRAESSKIIDLIAK